MVLQVIKVHELKASLGVTGNHLDIALSLMVESANSVVERVVGRPLEDGGVTRKQLYEVDGCSTAIHLKHYPVFSLTDVRDLAEGVTFDPSSYIVDSEAGILRRVDGSNWPKSNLQLQVQYRGGYRDTDGGQNDGIPIPHDLRQATLEIATQAFNQRRDHGLTSQSTGSVSSSYADMAIPPLARQILLRYRRAAWVMGAVQEVTTA